MDDPDVLDQWLAYVETNLTAPVRILLLMKAGRYNH